MTRKLFTVAILGIVSTSALLAVGCSSGNRTAPYALTGQSQAQVDQQHEEWLQQQRFTDQKGHYRPELAQQDRPAW